MQYIKSIKIRSYIGKVQWFEILDFSTFKASSLAKKVIKRLSSDCSDTGASIHGGV
jgi:hypothetical protein